MRLWPDTAPGTGSCGAHPSGTLPHICFQALPGERAFCVGLQTQRIPDTVCGTPSQSKTPKTLPRLAILTADPGMRPLVN